MTTLETLSVVFAVYSVVFLAHRATQAIDRHPELRSEDEEPSRAERVEAL